MTQSPPLSLRSSGDEHFHLVLGTSGAMRALYPRCAIVAASDVPVIIEGETGTGKEVLAESIHMASGRAQGPFVIFDCTAVPGNLLESALFGHERGSFTGAVASREGVFEQASGGTLLIDEIGDLDITLQPKLLRAIQRAEVQRVGGNRWIKTDVRVIAATRRNLEEEIAMGRFRDDLFYRLAVVRVHLPPLRERQGDIQLLARAFWRELGGEGSIPEEYLDHFEEHDWPGNVRELRNAVAHCVAMGGLSDLPPLRRSDPPSVPSPAPSTRSVSSFPASPPGSSSQAADAITAAMRERLDYATARERVLQEFHRRYLEWAIAEHRGNVTQAAKTLRIARSHLYKLLGRRPRSS